MCLTVGCGVPLRSKTYGDVQRALTYFSSLLAIFGAFSLVNDLIPNLVRLSLLFKGLVAAYRISRDWVFGGLIDLLASLHIVLPHIPELVRDSMVVVSLLFVALNYESMRHQGRTIVTILVSEVVSGLRAGKTNWTGLLDSELFNPEFVASGLLGQFGLGPSTHDGGASGRESRVGVAILSVLFMTAALLTWVPVSVAVVYGALVYLGLLVFVPTLLPQASVLQGVLAIGCALGAVVFGFVSLFVLLMVELFVYVGLFFVEYVIGNELPRARQRFVDAFRRFSWRFGRLWVLVTSPALAGILIVIASINAYRTVLGVLGVVAGLVAINALFLHVIDPTIAHPPPWLIELIRADPTNLDPQAS